MMDMKTSRILAAATLLIVAGGFATQLVQAQGWQYVSLML
jgi:hypothetical protein